MYSKYSVVASYDIYAGFPIKISKLTCFVSWINFRDPPSTMNISVTTLVGKVYSLECKSTDTVKQAKVKLHAMNGCPPEQQRFCFGGQLLHDHMILDDCHIQEGSVIHLLFCFRKYVILPCLSTITCILATENDIYMVHLHWKGVLIENMDKLHWSWHGSFYCAKTLIPVVEIAYGRLKE